TSPSFPNPIPYGKHVPQWALLDITLKNNWNNNTSFAVRDSHEITAGTVIPPSDASSKNKNGTANPFFPNPFPPDPLPPYPFPPDSLSNAGAIAGGQSPLLVLQSSSGCEESARRPRPPRSCPWVKSGRQGQTTKHTSRRPCLRHPPHL
ncbi:hypothetical protein BJV78DRAFT_1254430, partial [Lactifluus subvellereus]